MPFQAWIPYGLRQMYREHGSFNGAMPFQAWIRKRMATIHFWTECFNGAMPFQAWIRGGWYVCYPETRCASMGPCPFRHGYMDMLQQHLKALSLLQWGHALSGMDTQVAFSSITGLEVLQWGHALSGMDTSFYTTQKDRHIQSFNGAMPFQAWILHIVSEYTMQRDASMGPCPFRHGYSTRAYWKTSLRSASMGPCPFRHGYSIV